MTTRSKPAPLRLTKHPYRPFARARQIKLQSLRSSSAFGKQHKATFALKETDRRACYKVEKWSRDRQRIEELLFAENSLAKAQRIFERFVTKRPRSRLTIRQRSRVLQEWPPTIAFPSNVP